MRYLFGGVAIVLVTTSVGASSKESYASVPRVGCSSDGQLGPRHAPRTTTKRLHLRSDIAAHLAYYQAEDGPGVLGPRGWLCFGTYGSNGSSIYVSPVDITSKLIFSGAWKGFTGPGLQLSISFGGTSGRFSVASTIARVFPHYRAFVLSVQSEGFEPSTTKSATGPYSTDELKYLNDHTVEFTTPPHSKGLGTDSYLLPNSAPIIGVSLLSGADTDLIAVATRLPADATRLAPAIIQQVESEYAEAPPNQQ